MATIADLERNVQRRIEEEDSGPGVFWFVQDEIRVAIVECMNEATLITGEPQVRAGAVTNIPASTSFTPIALPSDGLALLRMEGPGGLPIGKVGIQDLDRHYPGWETTTGDEPVYWFPFGIGSYGIYPCLTAPAQVILNYVQIPVNSPRPYTGLENIPFQQEYIDGLEDGASHIASIKEAGIEMSQSMQRYTRFVSKMDQLSNFAYRTNSLRFTKTVGAQMAINDVRVR